MSFHPYPQYKDSGIEWLGEVPEHWVIKKLKWEITASSGTDQKSENGSYPLYGANGVIGTSDKATLFTPHVIIGRVGSAGEINYLEGDSAVSDNALIVKNNCYNSTRFDYYLFHTLDIKSSISKNAQPLITASDIRDHVMAAPTIEAERVTISTFLDHETGKIDGLIAEQERLIELLKEKRQATISHAVTKGLNPDAPMKDSGVDWLGEIPESWVVGKLRWYAAIQTGIALGKTFQDQETVSLPYLRVANVQDGYVDLSDVKELELLPKDVGRYTLESGDVLMNEGGDNDKLGRGTVWYGQISPCVHQNHVFAIRPHQRLLPEWLALVTQSAFARAYFFTHSRQSTNLASISSSNLTGLNLPFPSVTEQQQIIQFLNDETTKLDTLLTEAQRGIELLKERRSALISAAVTGKIDVRNWQPQGEAA